MKSNDGELTSWGIAKALVGPALLVFLAPILSWIFFLHAQGRFDSMAREATLLRIRVDKSVTEEQRASATKFFTEIPFSTLVLNEKFAADLDQTTLFNYATFRWMIRLSVLSIVVGVAVFISAGICVLFSMRSQSAQYISLSVGWQVLRIYGALQTIVMGILILALSYWVPALWFELFSFKLIAIAGVLAAIAAFLVIKAIFTSPKADFSIDGIALDQTKADTIRKALGSICEKVGVAPPDHIIAGIDDNFFVTEQPVTVNGTTYRGKTLFVSLPLLKQMNAVEAESVLAHEMAHFSGQDTLYSKKIAPLLMRYHNYLVVLQQGGITIPVFYFMRCFRVLFEFSIQKVSREREYRADRIAAQTTSAGDFAGAMLRIAAYSKFRHSVESDLFKQERAMESANVSDRIAKDFPAFAVAFASDPEMGLVSTAHPFDSHPTMTDRLNALGVKLTVEESQVLLSQSRDGGWHSYIPEAEELERQQWKEYEDHFRRMHEQSLPYRFLPETPEEQEIVERSFPVVEIHGKGETLTIDFEKIGQSKWSISIYYKQITRCVNNNGDTLDIHYKTLGDSSRSIKLKKYTKDQQRDLLETFQRYYYRYLAAVEFRKQMLLESDAAADAAPKTE